MLSIKTNPQKCGVPLTRRIIVNVNRVPPIVVTKKQSFNTERFEEDYVVKNN